MATLITVVLTLLVTIVGTITLPLLFGKRKQTAEEVEESAKVRAATTDAWTELTDAVRAERTELLQRLKDSDEDHRVELDAVRADFQAQLEAARRRITELEQELAALRRAVRDGGHA